MKLLVLTVVLIDAVTSLNKYHAQGGPGSYYRSVNYIPLVYTTGVPNFNHFYNSGFPGYNGAGLGNYYILNANGYRGHNKYNPYVTSAYSDFESGGVPGYNRFYGSGNYAYRPGGDLRIHFGSSGFRNSRYPAYANQANTYVGNGAYPQMYGYSREHFENNLSRMQDRAETHRNARENIAENTRSYRQDMLEHRHDMRQSIQDSSRNIGNPFGSSGFRNSFYPGYANNAYTDFGNGVNPPIYGYSREYFENNLSRMQDRAETHRNARENIAENTRSIRQDMTEHRRDMRQSIRDNNKSIGNPFGSSGFENSRYPGYVNGAFNPRDGTEIIENNLSRRQERVETHRNARENIAKNARNAIQDVAKQRRDITQTSKLLI